MLSTMKYFVLDGGFLDQTKHHTVLGVFGGSLGHILGTVRCLLLVDDL